MFDIGLPEFVVIALIALIVFGPDRMPEMVGQAARWIRKIRTQASDVTAQFTDGLDIPELADLTRMKPSSAQPTRVESLPARDIVATFDPDAT